MNIHTTNMSITTLLLVAGAGCTPDGGGASPAPRPRPGQAVNQAQAPAPTPTPAPSGATSTARLTGVIEHGDDGKIYMRLGGGGGRGADGREDVIVTPPARDSGCARVRWAGERPDFEDIASVLSLQMKLRERAGATRMGAPAGDRAAYKAWQAEGSCDLEDHRPAGARAAGKLEPLAHGGVRAPKA